MEECPQALPCLYIKTVWYNIFWTCQNRCILHQQAVPDAAILQKIRSNDLKGWEELYEAYAPAMLGIICKLTNDKKKGEQLLVKIFTGAEFETLLKNTDTGLPAILFKYSFCTTLSLLQAEGYPVEAGMIEGLPGIFKVMYSKNDMANKESVPFKNRLVWLPVYGPGNYPILCYS